MSKTQHTPGPWTADNIEGPCVTAHIPDGTGERQILATMEGAANPMANARLIAAAPELLAACEAALGDVINRASCQQIRDAIAKARGE